MGSYLGQNFLIDAKVRQYIADKISVLYKELGCEALIEIGPGKGAITKLIENLSKHFFVIEKDLTLVEGGKLRVEGGIIIQGDVLEVDVEKLLKEKKLDSKQTLVVGNLPYYITSPILRKFFGNGSQNFAGGVFMLQDEVGQKLRSDAKKKSYLRWLINYAYEVKYLKMVPAKCFKPIPKVKSCLVELGIRHQESEIGWEGLLQFLELFAPFSRKTLGSIVKIVEKQQVDKRFAGKAPSGRGESSPVARDEQSHPKFTIPESLKKKRLEELDFGQLAQILK